MISDSSWMQKIDHVVVLMLENRSFDHMLGYLTDGDVDYPPRGQSFEGLAGVSNTSLFKISESDLDGCPYFMPGADPGEGYDATNWQIFGEKCQDKPPSSGQTPTMDGFGTNWTNTLGWESKEKESNWHAHKGTNDQSIYGMFTPDLLPVMSTLAKSYAIFDHWYCSAPTETLPNRAFMHFATAEGQVEDKTAKDHVFKSESIFHRLLSKNKSWAIYGYEASSEGKKSPAVLTRSMVHDVSGPEYDDNYRTYDQFALDAQSGSLPNYSFLTPSWGAAGNSQHPPYDVAKGEQWIAMVFNDLRANQSVWNKTLFIITYDEHGGCYDHVPPPWGAAPPDAPADPAGQEGFRFDRFGLRIPTIMVSPWIEPGTVVSKPDTKAGGAVNTPFDLTSILATLEELWELGSLTARDKAAPHSGQVITLATPRTDNPLANVTPPESKKRLKADDRPGYLDQIGAHRMAQQAGRSDAIYDNWDRDERGLPKFNSYDDYWRYIHHYDQRLGWNGD